MDKDDPNNSDDKTRDDSGNVIEFISRKEYYRRHPTQKDDDGNKVIEGTATPAETKAYHDSPQTEVLAPSDDPLSMHFAQLANAEYTNKLAIPRELNRRQVVNSFHEAFALIGGVPRFALWAHGHPTEFYKLYARMLPSQATKDVGDASERVILHALPPTELDE